GELIAVEVAYRRRLGEVAGPDDYRDRFPGLDPAWFADPTPTTGPGTPPTQHLFCPHCHNPIELAASPTGEVLCPACGSTFRVHDDRATAPAGEARALGRF